MSELTQVLRHVLPVEDPNVLVGHTTGDDAAVYRLSDDRALVVTADFFTPIVDDPFDFGRIAAANALSDLYAMGARALFGLNLVGFPRKLLMEGLLEEILRGGGEVCRDAGIPVLGGHSIDDPEPKFGMVAVGEAHPERLITNAGARPGDVLVLTKPLGTGVVTTAIKADAAPADVVARAVEVMASLNRGASEAALDAGVPKENIVVDPGIGFGKTPDQNLEILAGLDALKAADCPIMVGTSRKSTLGLLLDLPADQRVEATAATVSLAIAGGADLIRVHDVKEMVRVCRVTDAVVRGWRPEGWKSS